MRRLLVVLIAVAACGDDSNRHIIDAPIQQPDGPNGDAPPAAVTLTITNRGVVVPSIRVYFQDADSHVVSATMTDTSGVASAVMGPGGFVTALSPFAAPAFGGPSEQLYTFGGVKPGDQLVLDTQSFNQISINVTLPASGGAGVTQYTVSTSCSQDPMYDNLHVIPAGSGAPLTGTLYLANCTGPADVVITAETTNGVPVQYIYLAAQTYTDQQVVDWSAEPYTTVDTTDFSYTNVPANANNFQLVDRVASAHGLVYAAYGGIAIVDTTTTEQLALPNFAGAAGVIDADIDTNTNTAHHFLDWGPYAAAFTTDVGARMLHELNAYPLQSATTPNTITWDEATTGGAPDWVIANLYVTRTADARLWGWNYVGPYVAGTFALPTLPVDVYDYNFAPADATSVTNLMMAKTPGGYDGARAHAFELELLGPQSLVVGNSGTATVVQALQTPTFSARTKRSWLRPDQTLRHRYR
jgi:hypothetical protein